MKITTNFKRFIILFLLLLLFIFINAVSYTHAVCTHISNSFFRLHVIANSDSDEDQHLKYIVRDTIIAYIQDISKDASSKEEVIDITNQHLSEIKTLALETIRNNNYNYDINVSIGNYIFPTKAYGDITLPAGCYDALKIEIGEAQGQNWWCVMFPPLCFVDVTSGIVPDESKMQLQENLSSEEYDLISGNNKEVQIKFKIVEVLQNFTISGIFM